MTVYVVGVVTFFWFLGFPGDILLIFSILWLGAFAWSINSPWRDHLRMLRDWLPLYALVIAYDVIRSFGAHTFAVEVYDPLRFDQLLFGGPSNLVKGGEIPTTWLQARMVEPAVQWWELPLSLVYISHFLTIWAVAMVLYLRARHLWAPYVRRFIVLMSAGMVTYLLYPAAPPWLAFEWGAIPQPINRMALRGWVAADVSWVDTAIHPGHWATNDVAAMPSLHAGVAMLVVGFLLPLVRKRWWPLLLAYPVAMAFTLVYAGEHYVTDILAGWAYVAATLIGVTAWERWRSRRATTRRDLGAPKPSV